MTHHENLFLRGKAVALTGTFENLTRAAAILKIKDAGAKYVRTIDESVDLLVIGKRSGFKKIQAEQLGIETLNEDKFLDLVGANRTPKLPGF